MKKVLSIIALILYVVTCLSIGSVNLSLMIKNGIENIFNPIDTRTSTDINNAKQNANTVRDQATEYLRAKFGSLDALEVRELTWTEILDEPVYFFNERTSFTTPVKGVIYYLEVYSKNDDLAFEVIIDSETRAIADSYEYNLDLREEMTALYENLLSSIPDHVSASYFCEDTNNEYMYENIKHTEISSKQSLYDTFSRLRDTSTENGSYNSISFAFVLDKDLLDFCTEDSSELYTFLAATEKIALKDWDYYWPDYNGSNRLYLKIFLVGSDGSVLKYDYDDDAMYVYSMYGEEPLDEFTRNASSTDPWNCFRKYRLKSDEE